MEAGFVGVACGSGNRCGNRCVSDGGSEEDSVSGGPGGNYCSSCDFDLLELRLEKKRDFRVCEELSRC